jgi:hypothetical protein
MPAKKPKNVIADNSVYEVPLSALLVYAKNPRRSDVEAISKSLIKNGQFRPIVVRRETREILAGNHTYQAAEKLGWEKIKVVYVEKLTDKEAARIVLADNRYNDLATYDVGELTQLLEEVGSLEGTGYDQYVLTNLAAAFQPILEDVPFESSEPKEKMPEGQAYECPKCKHGFIIVKNKPISVKTKE